ncbi:hypothetical protein PsYK624_152060 [Phanerochaete sordida]|uniref:Uncharacterized protein n=1 Tax=Phanerochaete sordida TaxID=48140 RepID=A0A9P3LKU0_9APHY|nr:hypothetical protein PsYK624_152060 [Phanerochaete sordida]
MVSAYDILLVYNQTSKVGLLDNLNMVYDVIPPVAGAIGNATVNASIYHVQCSALPCGPSLGDIDMDNAETFPVSDSSGAAVLFHMPYYPSVISGSIYNISSPHTPGSMCNQTSCWAPIVFSSTMSIIDSSGSENTASPGGPWRSLKYEYDQLPDPTISTLLECQYQS